MYHDHDWLESLIGTVVVGGLCYYSEYMGKQNALKEMEDRKKDKDFEELRRQFEELKKKST